MQLSVMGIGLFKSLLVAVHTPPAWRAPISAPGRTPPRQRASAAEPPFGEEQSGALLCAWPRGREVGLRLVATCMMSSMAFCLLEYLLLSSSLLR
jgi:hypothetical protein